MIGNYYLLLKFGDVVIPLSTSMLRELTIVQDFNKFLPEIRLRIDDATGTFTHLAPFDKGMSSIYVEFALDQKNPDKNSMSFQAYVREPSSNQSTPAANYDATGLLDVPKLFSPDFVRGFSGSMKDNIESIATGELGVDNTNVSISLDYEKNLVQPHWTNAQFLSYHSTHLRGSNEEYGYKCFITTYKGKSQFVFRGISEMINDPITYKFILNDTPYKDQNPILSYFIYDNYKIYGVFGAKEQEYTYYDYETGTFITTSEQYQNYTSLSDYFLIDESDTTDSTAIHETGRSTDFSEHFAGPVKSVYGNRLVGLAKMWITTIGLPNISPGNTVQIFFPHGAPGGDLYSFQYSGYWIVERVVHNMGDVFLTKLLLTRHGLDTDKNTSLVKAVTKKKA